MTQVKLPSIRYFQVSRVQRDCQGEMGNQALQVRLALRDRPVLPGRMGQMVRTAQAPALASLRIQSQRKQIIFEALLTQRLHRMRTRSMRPATSALMMQLVR